MHIDYISMAHPERVLNMEQGPLPPIAAASKIQFIDAAIRLAYGERILIQLRKSDETLTLSECLLGLRRQYFPNGNGNKLEITANWRGQNGGTVEYSFSIYEGNRLTLRNNTKPLTTDDISFLETLEQEADLRFALYHDPHPNDYYIPKRNLSIKKSTPDKKLI